MKFKGILYFVILAALASCSNDDDNLVISGTPKTIIFGSSVIEEQGVLTRAQGNTWNDKDSIGVFMKQAGQKLSHNTVIDRTENKKYITMGTGIFSPSAENEEIYYPTDDSDVDFIAYYPYTKEIQNFNYPIDLSDQKSQESIDLLYSDNIKQINVNSSKAMILRFTHQLVKLKLNISLADGSPIHDELLVTISGMKTKASFALDNGTLVIDESSDKEIAAKVTSSPSEVIAEATLLAQEATEGRFINISSATIGSYTWSIPTSVKYEKGKKYTYNISLEN